MKHIISSSFVANEMNYCSFFLIRIVSMYMLGIYKGRRRNKEKGNERVCLHSFAFDLYLRSNYSSFSFKAIFLIENMIVDIEFAISKLQVKP